MLNFCLISFIFLVRKSDSVTLKAQLKLKARRCFASSQFRVVDFVIFVVNGISVLESMDSDDATKKQYSQMIASDFNNPLLSFKGTVCELSSFVLSFCIRP